MALTFNSLTERVKQVLGGVQRQGVRTLSDIGSNLNWAGNQVQQNVVQPIQQAPAKIFSPQNINAFQRGVLAIPSGVQNAITNTAGGSGIPSFMAKKITRAGGELGKLLDQRQTPVLLSKQGLTQFGKAVGTALDPVTDIGFAPKVAPAVYAGSAILGGGLAGGSQLIQNLLNRPKDIGRDVLEQTKMGISQGIAQTPKIGAIASITNPAIMRVSNKFLQSLPVAITSKLSDRGVDVINRVIQGTLSIPEGKAIAKALGQEYTPLNAAIDFAVGAGLAYKIGKKAEGVVDKKGFGLSVKAVDEKSKIPMLPNETIGAYQKRLEASTKPLLTQFNDLVSSGNYKQAEDVLGQMKKQGGVYKEYIQPLEGILKPKKQVLDPLIQEAKKYKSAEEFVDFNAPTVYRGSTGRAIKSIPSEGLSVTKDFNIANQYAKARGLAGQKDTLYIKPNAKVITLDEIPNDVRGSGEGGDFAGRAAIWARKQGYDILDMSKGNEAEMRILNKEAIISKEQSKSQLTDIWNQANKGVDINKAIDIESSIINNVSKIQQDFLDGKITIEQRKALADKEFARSIADKGVGTTNLNPPFQIDRTKLTGKQLDKTNAELMGMYGDNIPTTITRLNKQAQMMDEIARGEKQAARLEAELRAGVSDFMGLNNNDKRKFGQLKTMFQKADENKGAWDVELLKKDNKTLVDWATERWRELYPQKSSMTDDELITDIYDFVKNNQLSGKIKTDVPQSVYAVKQLKAKAKDIANQSGYYEEQMVPGSKPVTLDDSLKQLKIINRNIDKKYKARDLTTEELDQLYNMPDHLLKGRIETDFSKAEISTTKGVKDTPSTFREIINKFLGGKANARLTQYEVVKPIADIKFTDDSAKQAIRAIETGDTKDLSPKMQEYITNLRSSFDNARLQAMSDGIPVGYVNNYLTHYWKQDPVVVQNIINGLKKKGAFQNNRTFLTYDEGIEAGLTPVFKNPTQILGNYIRQVENLRNNLKLINDLESNGYIVSGMERKLTRGVREIAIPGFEGKFAKPEIAQFIENLFEPKQANKVIGTLGKISGLIQEGTLSGGVFGTPFNAFSVSANLQKHFLSGRFTGPVKSFVRAFSPESTTKYFNENIPAIREIQGAGYNLPTTLSYNKLMGEETTGLGKVWNMAVSDPTFKRFIPMLQIDLYKEVKNKALKQGLSAEQAIDKGIQVLKNFEGLSDQYSIASADPNAQATIRTIFFAPKFRKAIIDIWLNSIKSVGGAIKAIRAGDRIPLENQYNLRFLAGSILAFAGYNAANAHFNNGKMMWENGRNKEDKLIIPDGQGGEIGIPFLSSLATIPRGIARQALKVVKGDVAGAATDAGQTYLSSGIKPLADIAANQDYFGKTIVQPDSKSKWGDILGYLGRSYISHPYLKELFDPRNTSDPAYQRLFRAMELPFRFYDAKSVSGSKYYEARDRALEGMNEVERKAYDVIPKYDANNPDTQIFKYQTFLTFPNVFEAKRMTEFNLAKQTGKAIDPLYLVNYDTAKAYMRYETLPPGSQDRKELLKAKPELGALFDVRSKYFEENPIEGQTKNNRPLPSEYVQQQMDVKNWSDPQVRAYLDANTAWQNEQRAKWGLPPLAEYASYTKKPRKLTVKSIKAARIKMAKVKIPKLSKSKLKIPKQKKLVLKRGNKGNIMRIKA